MSAFGCAAKCVASSVSRSVIDDDADRGGGGELLGAQHGRDLLGAGIALCEVVERLQRARPPLIEVSEQALADSAGVYTVPLVHCGVDVFRTCTVPVRASRAQHLSGSA